MKARLSTRPISLAFEPVTTSAENT